jgi:hypothetical protein
MRRLSSRCQLKILEGIVIIQHTKGAAKDLVLEYGLTSFIIGSVPMSLQLVYITIFSIIRSSLIGSDFLM